MYVAELQDAGGQIAWEETPCPLCAGADFIPRLEGADPLSGRRFLVVQCAACGLCCTNPRPDPITIRQFYPADYRCHQLRPDRSGTSRSSMSLRWLMPSDRPGRLLDFGCGSGAFLRRMQALGWDATGLDSAEQAVTQLRGAGVRAHVGTLPTSLWNGPSFDLITMWQSLEHVHQPLEVLRAARDLLMPGGRLVVTAPNFAGLGSRWFGTHWHGLDLPRHLTHFTSETLRQMLSYAGFDQIEIRQQQHPSWIRHSATRAGGRFLRTRFGSSFLACWGTLTGQAESILAVAGA